jgi:hypothetical protein
VVSTVMPEFVGQGKLTDKVWAQLEPLLAPVNRRGRRWCDHRQAISSIS